MNVESPDWLTTHALVNAFLSGTVGIAGSYAVAGASSSFVAVPVHSLVVDLMPAPILTVSILALGKIGDVIGFWIAVLATLIVLALVALLALVAGNRYGTPAALGTTYFGGWGVATLVTGAPWASLGTAIPMLVVVGFETWRSDVPAESVNRTRRVVVRGAGALVFSGIAYFAGNRTQFGAPPRLSTIPADEQAAIKRRLEQARSKSLGVQRLTGLVSSVSEFYEVDIDSVNPGVDVDNWTLTVTGAVDSEYELTYDELTSMDLDHQFVSLRCVGESLNDDLLDNALWTGVPANQILDRAGVDANATHVVLHAVDGFTEEFPIEAFENGMFAYGMNGHLLPRSHGYPVRALVLGHWGEVNVKWLTEVEVITGERKGYWEKRGWHGTGPANIVAKLHAVNHLDGGRIQVGGHAYAGLPGVSRVEVSVDGERSWNDATLSEPLQAEDVWRQWEYTYPSPGEEHDVVVRAIDGEGTVQPQSPSNAFPSGATGWVSKRITP